LKKRYGWSDAEAPQDPYRETIRGRAEVQGRHKKQTGGHGQFGDCWIRMSRFRAARNSSSPMRFLARDPENYIPAVEKGIIETLEWIFGGFFRWSDFSALSMTARIMMSTSSELAFKLAARKAFKIRNAARQAGPAGAG